MARMLLLFLSLLLLCSCASTNPLIPTEQQSQAQNSAQGTGTITGVLLDESGQPIADLGVFVASLTDGPDGAGKIISFQPTSSQQDITDQEGRFVIENVPEGSYSLAVWTPNSSQLLPDASGSAGSALLAEVEAGQIEDVGTIKIKRPA